LLNYPLEISRSVNVIYILTVLASFINTDSYPLKFTNAIDEKVIVLAVPTRLMNLPISSPVNSLSLIEIAPNVKVAISPPILKIVAFVNFD
jgi:hypothetical protein